MLFQIEDADRPMFIVCPDFESALSEWRTMMANENEIPAADVDGPDGIACLESNSDDVVIGAAVIESILARGVPSATQK